jgi:hypothetical protein
MAHDLYETDFALWSEQQAQALRRRAANEIDWDNVAEEIESLGNRERRELEQRIETVLDHLMRLNASPAHDPRRGWRRTITEQRSAIAKILRDSPGLRPAVASIIAAGMPTARQLTAEALEEYGETPRIPLNQLTYTEVEVLGRWLPEEEQP